MSLLIGATMLVGLMQPIPERLIGLPVLAFTLTVVAAHLLVSSGVVGLFLVLCRRSLRPKLTLASAVVGMALGVPVLGTIYAHAVPGA